MVNFRRRVKGKGKRWKKGHSSSSNPETKKFRDVAKSRFFQENAEKKKKKKKVAFVVVVTLEMILDLFMIFSKYG
ncbi:hypothetical protein ANN_15086 [Periplaneta americana]|uniref:Uncharacterized protein n=1 Tax=Periplaneta americana TaxID=6978 RepID=A0ABQ8SZ91_PERAM|nr:hypothetical protein ANN_15086 [Periplaneta americana]